ncbi:hypothetical protein [Terrabacter sp. 2RAF25]|uniref:hypothetical protein n=1 Tax=Terrabacter sp. 2RAF25 TaxID=3232998 RepID=UPI003F98DEBE
MALAHSPGTSDPRSRRAVGWQWWAALVIVTVLLGFAGRGDGGFWGVFLWSIVGFVVGSLVAIAITGRGAAGRTEPDAAPGDAASASGGRR